MKLIALCGQSGAGKDSVLSKLVSEYPNTFKGQVSHTTRDPREGEVDGKDYHFVTREEFFDKLLNGEMLEADDFNEEVYGTAYDSLTKDKINIGIFTPTGIEIMASLKEIDLLPIYIRVSDQERIKRVLERDTEATIDEIYGRYKLDRQRFDGVEFMPEVLTIDNENGELDSVVSTIRLLAENMMEL